MLNFKTRQAYYFLKRNKKLELYREYLSGCISREQFYAQIPNRIFKRVINKEINELTLPSIFGEIDKIRKDREVDIIIGGPPCQAYSVIGRSRDPKGMKYDKRNYLYKDYIKFLNKYSPKLFVFENVLGLLSAQKGKIFTNMKKEFKQSGYNIDYKILNAKDFGVLEDRKRIILIGWREEVNFKYPEFHAVENNYTIRDLFSDLPFIKSGEYSTEYKERSNECLQICILEIKNGMY
ncbi:DNA cytosine methyltransferase [Clostridium beijerinckii]|uniref:DNA cytosine methyltransferase n=1 Tax=Clostridium beijerinckii TaxID=1520 RepID=UPI001F4BE0B5|nr:DNA (cytosine-5-)-methyltransferase [Clostridium beijerinckii]NRT75512.1 DNA-cytosine methyltransferase [Clostridium beijerinckii]